MNDGSGGDDSDLARAKTYPYPRPDRSFLFGKDGNGPLDDVVAATAGRIPVIAAGSNAAPSQLQRKFGDFPGHLAIPVEHVRICGFDSVYAAHLTDYGAVPATLARSAGTVVRLHITWLTETELDRMDASEAKNYEAEELQGMEIAGEGGRLLESARFYRARAGILSHGGAPVALAEIAADNRRFAARTQIEILARLHDRLAPGRGLDAFILETVDDPSRRDRHKKRIAADAIRPG